MSHKLPGVLPIYHIRKAPLSLFCLYEGNPIGDPGFQGHFLGLSPALMPLVHSGRNSPLSSMLLDSGLGMPMSPAALSLQHSMMQNNLLNDLKTLQELGNLQKSAIYAKETGKRVVKATASKAYKKQLIRPAKKVGKPGSGPLPPPPSLLSIKQWQKIKIQLDTGKPKYNPAA
ncbi:unnamed protein product [Cylindrotheca closterium]|uniref:Uncharacterized protein n=1 Tax=Cylindrotheca closterium TaxID=2856 RepID=A0AAD2FCX1_9STRA|nr:unnamed protein product [Cylindrotheca closterium]